MSPRKTLVALASLFLLLGATPSVPQVGESIEVSIVNVDVVVTDRDGNRVRGLTRGDFEILEGGKSQPISNFAEYRSDATSGAMRVDGPATGAAQQAARRQPRTIVVFLERMPLVPVAAKRFTDGIRDLLHATVAPGDSVAMVIWSRSAINTIGFSDDLSVVDAALDEYAEVAGGAAPDRTVQHAQYLRAARDFESSVAERAARLITPGGRAAASPPPSVETKMLTGDSATRLGTAAAMTWAFSEMKMRVAAINSTLDMMAGAEGKKILLLTTHRLGRVAGAEHLFNAGEQFISPVSENEFRTDGLTESLIDKANASGVTIYPLYPPGLGPEPVVDASIGNIELPIAGEAVTSGVAPGSVNQIAINETSSLERIAERTGGRWAMSVNDIVRLLPEVATDMSDYYSLAYRITTDRADRARDIQVRTKNREYRVRARREFVEKSDDTVMKDRLSATLFGVTPRSEIPLDPQIGRTKKTRKRTTIPLSVRIPISSLTALPQGESLVGAFSVYVATAADLDEVSDFTKRTQPFTFSAEQREQAAAGHFTYDLDVIVNEKARYLAVGVFDEVSKTSGFVRIALEEEARETHAAAP